MSGGQSASVVSALQNEVAALQYPPAAASAVIMVIIVTLMVAGILRAGRRAQGTGALEERRCMQLGRRLPALDLLCLRGLLHAVRAVPLRADDGDLHPVVPGPKGGMTFPMNGVSLALVRCAVLPDAGGRHRRRRSRARSGSRSSWPWSRWCCRRSPPRWASGGAFRGSAFVFYLADRQPDHARPVRRASASRSPSGCSGCRPTGTPRGWAPSSPGRCRSGS